MNLIRKAIPGFVLAFIFVSSCTRMPVTESTPIQKVETVFPTNSLTSTKPASTPALLTQPPAVELSATATSVASVSGRTIYLATSTYDTHTAQIWKLSESGANLIYQQNSLTATDSTVPTNVQNEIREYLNQNPDQASFEKVELGVFFTSLKISSDRKYLVWLEELEWCPAPASQNCFGFRQLPVLDLETNLIKAVIRAGPVLPETIDWSPSGQFLVFATARQYSGFQGEVWNADIDTKQLTSLGRGEFPVWSPDGQRIAILFYPSLSTSELRIKIISPENPSIEQIVNYPWTIFGLNSLSWAPTTNALAIAASTDPEIVESQRIFLIDTKTLLVSIFPAQTTLRILSYPHWSADGNLLAVNARESRDDKVTNLIVFKPTGEVLSNFSVSGDSPERWIWSSTAEPRILRLLGSTPPRPDDLQILDPFTSQVEIVQLPTEIRNGIEIFSSYISSITW